MSNAPDHSQIFARAVEEGKRRLDQSSTELVSTSFIAGYTIVFGIVAQGIVLAASTPRFSELADVFGALAFGIGIVFLIVGRAELFNENFFDPTATVVERREPGMIASLVRLWALTLVFNLVGGGIFILVLSVEGTLPPGAEAALRTTAEEIARRESTARLASAIVGGSLISLLSFLLVAVDSAGSRIALAYTVGVVLALGPFDHVIVTMLHVGFGILTGAPIGVEELVSIGVVVTAGNFIGGIGLTATTHIVQAEGAHQ